MRRGVAIFLITVSVLAGAVVLVSWRRKAGNLAAQFIDIKEIGDNAGFSNEIFQKMMRSVGWQGGEAWCMYFAKSIYMQAFPKKAPEINKVLTGSTQQSWQNAKAHPDLFKIITHGNPQKGDIIIWQSTTNGSLGHAGIVYKKDEGDTWYTIEGNSGLGGTREGQGVVKLKRDLTPGTIDGKLRLLGFIRLKTDLWN